MPMDNCTSKNFSTSSEFVLGVRVQTSAHRLCFFGTILRGIKTAAIEFKNMVKESLYPLLYNPLRLALKSLETAYGGVLVYFYL